MPLSHLMSTWWRIWRHQRLLWGLLAVQTVLVFLLLALVQALDLVTLENRPLEGATFGTTLFWEVTLGVGGLAGAVLFGLVQSWLSVAIIRLVDLGYPQPEKPITWQEISRGLWKWWLRWLGVAFLMGGLLILFVIPVLLALGFLGLGGSIMAEGGEPAGAVLTGLLFLMFFLGVCVLLPLGWLVVTPFLTGVSIAVVIEPLPWPDAIGRGIRIVWKWFLWWVLLMALYLVVSFIATLLGLPFTILYAIIQIATTEGQLPFWVMAVLGWPLNALPSLISLVVGLWAFTWFVVFYRYLSDQLPREPVTQQGSSLAAGTSSTGEATGQDRLEESLTTGESRTTEPTDVNNNAAAPPVGGESAPQ